MDRAGARASPPRRSQLGQSPRDEIEAVLAPEEFVPDHEGRHAEHALLDRGIGVGVVLAPYRLVLRGLEERGTVGAVRPGDLEQGGRVGEIALFGPDRNAWLRAAMSPPRRLWAIAMRAASVSSTGKCLGWRLSGMPR